MDEHTEAVKSVSCSDSFSLNETQHVKPQKVASSFPQGEESRWPATGRARRVVGVNFVFHFLSDWQFDRGNNLTSLPGEPGPGFVSETRFHQSQTGRESIPALLTFVWLLSL